MTLKSRVEKAVEMSGVGLPCWLCEAAREAGEAFNAHLRAHAVAHPTPVMEESRCLACGRMKMCDASGLSEVANEARRRVVDALADYKAGLVGWPVCEAVWREYEDLDLHGGVEIFGAHYLAAREAMMTVIHRHVAAASTEQRAQLQPAAA